MRVTTFPLNAGLMSVGLAVCSCLPGSGTPTNFAPTADAGPDAVVILGDTAMLSGTATDAENDPLSFIWRIIACPVGSVCAIDDPSAQDTFFVPDVPGQYQVGLTANDGTHNGIEATVMITASVNTPPVAEAGDDVYLFVGDTVSLDGSASSDAEGHALTFAWTVASAPGGSLASPADPSAAATTLAPDVPGDYSIELVVNDGYDDSAPATVGIHASANTPPVADAGDDQYVLIGVPALLDGSASSDADAHDLAFAWTLTSAPGGSIAGLSDPASATTSFTPDVLGDYTIELVVNDGYDDSAPATAILHAVSNIPPLNDAGPDQAVLMGDTVVLDGTGCSDAEGDPFTLSWTLVSKPSGSVAALDDPSIVNPSFVPDEIGTYTLALVADDGAAREADQVNIVVATNLAPTADAGDDFMARRNEAASCSGAGSDDPEGRALIYSWTLVSQPAGGTATLGGADTSVPWFTPDVLGDYTLELVVNDGFQDSTIDTVVVTATDNLVPIARAGEDFALLTGRIAYLSGYRSWDPDNDLLDFSWSIQSAPAGSTANIYAGSGAMRCQFTTDIVGEYIVELIVSDGQLDSVPDTVTVTASDTPLPPTVDGGGEQLAIIGFEYHFSRWSSFNPNSGTLVSYDMLATPLGPGGQYVSYHFTPTTVGTYVFEASIDTAGFLVTDPFTVEALDLYDPVLELGLDAYVPVVAIGDVTGDGADDMILVTDQIQTDPPLDGKLLVYEYASGSLQGPEIYELPSVSYLSTAAIADVTGDGLKDVIVGASADLHVFPQTLAGDLGTPTTYTSALAEVHCLEVGDFNNDGRMDVVCAPWEGDVDGKGVEVFLQLADGTLAPPVTYGIINEGYTEICTGDLNGDGLADVVVVNGQGLGPNVGVLYQTPTGTLGGLRYFDPGGGRNAGDADVGDVNGDGRDDLVIVYGGNYPDAEFAILYQLPNGKLDAPVAQTCYDIPEGVRLADVDGNGLEDIVVSGSGARASVHLQKSIGRFSSYSVSASRMSTFSSGAFATGDLNGDGRPDIVLGDDDPNGADIYFSRTAP